MHKKLIALAKEEYERKITRVRELIPLTFYSFSEVAEITGVDVSTVSRIVNGQCKPTYIVLTALTLAIEDKLKQGETVNEDYHY